MSEVNGKHDALVSFVERSGDLFKGEGPTLKHIYEMCVDEPNKRAVTYFDEDGRIRHYDYKKYNEYALLYGSYLSALFKDIPYDEPIGLKIKNLPAWPYLFFGILMSGHRPLLLDYRQEREKTAVLLGEAGAKAIIVNEEEDYEVATYRLRDLKKAGKGEIGKWADHVYLCTSGTTGASRIMVYNGEDFCHQIRAALVVPGRNRELMKLGKINILAMIPFHHIFGLVAVLLWFTFYHKNLVYPTSISSKDLLDAVKKGKCTHVFSVPMLFDQISTLVERSMKKQSEKLQAYYAAMAAYNRREISKKEAGFIPTTKFFNRLLKKRVLGPSPYFLISGGGYLSEETHKTLEGLGYPLHNGIGMTEVGITSVELSTDPVVRLKDSVGLPFYGVTYKRAKNGELLIKSPYVHKEEIIGGKLSKTPLDEEGFFHSGDLVDIDEDGRVYIRGRLKETIINGNGENVYPDELEEHFRGLKGTSRLSVLGVKNGNGKDEDIYLVYEKDPSNYDVEALKADFKERNAKLNPFSRVNRLYLSLSPLPLANGIKVKRLAVAKAIEEGSKDYVDIFSTVVENKKDDTSEKLKAYPKEKVEGLLKEIEGFFASTLALSPEEVKAQSDFGADLGGDSMSYVAMVAEINSRYGIELEEENYGKLLTPEDFVLYLLKKRK